MSVPLPGASRVIISAPFGNYLKYQHCTSTCGTFTSEYRGSLLYRIWRMIRTLRYDRRTGGWVNKLGLPNPGIDQFIKEQYGRAGKPEAFLSDPDCQVVIKEIVSLHGFSAADWDKLVSVAFKDIQCTAFELNVSCPNVNDSSSNWTRLFSNIKSAANGAELHSNLIVKIPPVNYRMIVDAAIDVGIFAFHACNTLPCKSGGMSGPILRPFVFEAIQYIRQELASPTIIAGGGVQSVDDAKAYIEAGASHIAVGSALLNPLNRNLPSRLVEELSWDCSTGGEKSENVGDENEKRSEKNAK